MGTTVRMIRVRAPTITCSLTQVRAQTGLRAGSTSKNQEKCEFPKSNCPYGLWLAASGARRLPSACRAPTLPAVQPKIHHRPEPLYRLSEVNTLQVDWLACIPGFTQALYKLNPQPQNASRDPPRLIHLSVNTEGTFVPPVPILKGVRVRERGRGQPMHDLVVGESGLLTTK